MDVVHHSSFPGFTTPSFAVPSAVERRFVRSRRPPLETLSYSDEVYTEDKIISFNSAPLKLGLYPFNRAAAPATHGAAIEVPLKYLYSPPGTVL